MKKTCIAIVLAAGQGKRMESKIQKQYLEIHEKPVLYYSLHAMEESKIIDQVILVVGEGQISYCQKEIVERYGFHKIYAVVEGGKERYDSVFQGLQEMKKFWKSNLSEIFVFIHDGARPFVTEDILERAYVSVERYGACVVGMPVKDTIKIADEDGFANETPDRSRVWMVQTPQVFAGDIICDAYEQMMETAHSHVTDDGMIVEAMSDKKVKFVEGSYENIKITTPEDLKIAELFVQSQKIR